MWESDRDDVCSRCTHPPHSISTRGEISMTKDNYWLSLAPLSLISARGVSVCLSVCAGGGGLGDSRRNRGIWWKEPSGEKAPADPQWSSRRGRLQQKERNDLLRFSSFQSSTLLLFFCFLTFWLVFSFCLSYSFPAFLFCTLSCLYMTDPPPHPHLRSLLLSLHYHNLRGWKAWRAQKEEKGEQWKRGDPADEGLPSRRWHRCEGVFVKWVGEGRR